MKLCKGYENAIKKVQEYQKCHPFVGYCSITNDEENLEIQESLIEENINDSENTSEE